MARLNEPMVSTDSIETLRRKFLRQNRDIARINSTQSLKIRCLENECARMLSENLELRGQIIRLETELQQSSALRIADHALEIKEKMEAQLLEWGAMLASLGNEPLPKDQSPRASKRPKIRSSLGRVSTSEWRRRDTISSMKDLEAAAQQEGKLPPIWENKACPRETLNREEILALCCSVEENADSPDLGPPPVSRFVDEDPVKIDLPTKSVTTMSDSAVLQERTPTPEAQRTPTKTIEKVEDVSEGGSNMNKAELEAIKSIVTAEPEATVTKLSAPTGESQSTAQAVKPSLKRKIRDEDEKENPPGPEPPTLPITATKAQREKTAAFKARPNNRAIKDLSNRREGREKMTGSVTQRKPLGVKNSNEALHSPKKAGKPPISDEVAKAKTEAKRAAVTKEKTKAKEQRPAPIEIPAPPVPAASSTATIEVMHHDLATEPEPESPDSPVPTAPRDDIRDTPPPSDILSRGENSRGSRRARAAVSYAEPNLRDKMRRPTKELFDAVSGEGRNIRRTSQSKKDEPSSHPFSMVKTEDRSASSKSLSAARGANSELDIMASPLIQKTVRAPPSENLDTTVTERRKADSSSSAKGTDSESSSSTSIANSNPKTTTRRLDEIAAREAEVARLFDEQDEQDVYEFPSPTPKNQPKQAAPEEGKKARGRPRHSRSRRLSSMGREDLDISAENPPSEKGSRQGGPRKRASMMGPAKSGTDAESTGQDSSLEGESLSSTSPADAEEVATKDRAAVRRRSMML
ncbi:hypothetical protein F4779DRAFT_177915 [Xylariaceae sp. FL0662B]|nr:hypothetical protein F4779DRAFT_177915 [Xylariaceae sp. FL0662B]